MTPTSIACESRIQRVTVYARGAVVARRLTLPAELPEGAIDIEIHGVTALAELGSIRAFAEGDRAIVALRSKYVAPPPAEASGSLREQLRDLHLKKIRLKGQRAHLKARRDLMASLPLDPGMARASRRVDPTARVGDALALSGLLSEEIEKLDERLQALDEAIFKNDREIEATELAAGQARTSDLEGDERPSVDVLLRVAKGAPNGLRGLEIEYVIRPARWFPAYSARFSAGATRVEWSIEALVAQASGEDWSHVELALSTADLVTDARLPELSSLRLGRAQPPARKGYRAAPEGLDVLFEGYDRFAATVPPPALARRRPSVEMAAPSGPATTAEPIPLTPDSSILREDSDGDAFFTLGGRSGRGAAEVRQRLTLPSADTGPATAVDMPSYAAAFGAAGGGGGTMPPPAQTYTRAAPPAPGGMAIPEAAKRGGWGFPPQAPPRGGGGDMLEASAPAAWETATPAGIEPAEAWLDFDALVLRDPKERVSRGRLVRDDASAERALRRVSTLLFDANELITELEAPVNSREPRDVRGSFDHRYDAEGLGDIPSSGRAHRVPVALRSATASPRFVTVPREALEVYREVEIKNPFQAPLLAGPVEVFVDGALLTQSSIAQVDQGGSVFLGLGVEDRIRVARNARVEEGSAGLLGGSTTVEHAVTIDLTSSLGMDLDVTVIDRIPVTDDKDIEIKTLFANPAAEAYTQAERGRPIRRGMRWQVPVPAGGKARVELGYRITLPSKNEIVGGNRREG